MLNLSDTKLKSIVASDLSPLDARNQVSAQYTQLAKDFANDPEWQTNQPAATSRLLSYTDLLAAKLMQAFAADKTISDTFLANVWPETVANDGTHSAIGFNLNRDGSNLAMFTISNPLDSEASLVANNLPTLLQVTAKEQSDLGYADQELTALSNMIKSLYTANYTFKQLDDTVLQPVDQLTFKTKYDNNVTISSHAHVVEAGNIELQVALNPHDVVTGYHVFDDAGHDWMDLGSEEVGATDFTWESTTIPEELVGNDLELQVAVRSINNAPALDELFVIASSNAILMRQLAGDGRYELALPNKQSLTVTVNPQTDTVTLHYPESTVQIYELNQLYPFLGEWLKSVSPKKPAFN
ncbi:hypothetical protein [Lacticaseibacillus brantae]|uniref:Uncharacterized protein n=1 Tax=Lacticaseibacillus brantae DSM 23927 TaxID=1423727 RepID=A0A0R2B6K8_9LACO|nr:hypothetical protein [Lacticaseibacillus brantae]KRM71913.1 hypothetical protein FC34_GL000891 [Lacticaseibacillus brantae DSM 23927]